MNDKMRSEPHIRASSYLAIDNNNNNNSPPAFKRSLSSLTSASSTSPDSLGMMTIPDNLLKTTGVVADTQRSSSLSTLCAAMFTEWESQEYLDSFYEQLLELQGSRVCNEEGLFTENIRNFILLISTDFFYDFGLYISEEFYSQVLLFS